ncbi:MAG: hypothetical protein LBG97_03525 [Coriobacteriales bacterium]|jgi:hypothetical protein|nr:hypothetical protein [Coriobacteriales bacterium]
MTDKKKLTTIVAVPDCEIKLNGVEYDAILVPKERLVIMDYTKHPEILDRKEKVLMDALKKGIEIEMTKEEWEELQNPDRKNAVKHKGANQTNKTNRKTATSPDGANLTTTSPDGANLTATNPDAADLTDARADANSLTNASQDIASPNSASSDTANTDNNINAAFKRLEEMVAELPQIQAKNERLAQASEARRLIELRDIAKGFKDEIDSYDQTIEKARTDVWEAVANNDDITNAAAQEKRNRGLLLIRAYTEMRASRLHVAERAKNLFNTAMGTTSLNSDNLPDELDALALTNEEYYSLQNMIDNFKQEYEQLYNLCNDSID